ncbi:MAG: endo alpha-1,4 polygalactosaminidase [Deltaproteobacteria bacterium]|nr:endo alpha-1,4 polygalactosaminidase [Deltaproteobacteria bacterium]
MRALSLLLGFALLTGCLPWGDASQWSGVPAGIPSWEWILDEGAIPSSPPAVDYLGLDAFDTDARYVDEAVANGTRAWCYVSVGTAEDWRDDWAAFVALDNAERDGGNPSILGDDLAAWPGERWLDIARYPVFLDLMSERFRTCVDKGFTLVEFDNMDAYANPTGLGITEQDARAYAAALVSEAQDRGLSVIHKNAVELVDDLEPSMEALLLESCVLHEECDRGAAFLPSGKPVFNVEYPSEWQDAGRSVDIDDICAQSEAAGANTVIKTLELDDRSIVCAAR